MWPVGALYTLRTAKRLGIPTVLERLNAHTGLPTRLFKKNVRVSESPCRPGRTRENEDILRIEKEEYALADYLLCPQNSCCGLSWTRDFLKRN